MNYDQSYTVVAPIATFQSTSTMQGSGSTYSSNPMLNAEGHSAVFFCINHGSVILHENNALCSRSI